MVELNTTLTARHAVGREATYQAEALLRELLRAAHRDGDLEMLTRGMVPRLLTLVGITMMALDATESADPLDELRNLLDGGYSRML
jgi:hypothetical protein